MTTINVFDASDSVVAIEKPLAPGRGAASASRPVVLSTEDAASLTSLATLLTTIAGSVGQITSPVDVNANVKSTLFDSAGDAIAFSDAGQQIKAVAITVCEPSDSRIKVGGKTSVFRPTVTVQATPDYSDGDSIGPLLTLTPFASEPGGSGIITRFQLRSLISITVGIVVHIFDANPSASGFSDNSALSIDATDRDKILKSFTVASTDWVVPKGANPYYTVELSSLVQWPSSGIGYDLAGITTDLYIALEADGTINFASTADLGMIVGYEEN